MKRIVEFLWDWKAKMFEHFVMCRRVWEERWQSDLVPNTVSKDTLTCLWSFVSPILISFPLCGRQLYYVVALDQYKLAFMYLPVILFNSFSPHYLYFYLKTKIMIHFQPLYLRTTIWIILICFLTNFLSHYFFFVHNF